MKTFIAVALALFCAASMTACTSCSNSSSSSSSSMSSDMSSEPSSSSMPSSSMPSSSASSSSLPSSSSGVISDLESAGKDAISDVESIVTPTMGADFNQIGSLDPKAVLWGAGVLREENGRTSAPVMLQEKYKDFGTFFIGPEDCGKLYLTFDEGYENGFTPAILDTLKEKDAHAVFFLTLDFAKREALLVQRMIDEGHLLGNHTAHHWTPTDVPIEQAYEDIQTMHDYMIENFDYTMYLYRPPTGAFSERTLEMTRQMGYTTVLWSFAYKDYDVNNQPDYDTAYKRTTDFIHEGGIYLLHAVSKTNAEILGPLIDEVRAAGLEVADWDLSFQGAA